MRKKRKYVWARAAITKALSEEKLSWTELLDRSGVSRGALSMNLRRMLTDGSIVIETDTDSRPPKTMYALGKTTPFYVERPVVKDERFSFDDAWQELMEAAQKMGLPNPEISAKSVEALEGCLDEIIASSAECAVILGLMKSCNKTLFINPSPAGGPLVIGNPTIRWFEGSMEDAKQLLVKDALENALDIGSHLFELIKEHPTKKDTKEITEETYEEVGRYWQKKVRSGIYLKIKELQEKGVFRVTNKGGVGIVFFSLEDFLEQYKKRFEEKYGIVDFWRSLSLRLIKPIDAGAKGECGQLGEQKKRENAVRKTHTRRIARPS